MTDDASRLTISSPAFSEGGRIPVCHTGFGDDASPELRIDGLCAKTVSLAVTLDDLDVPFTERFNHWCIWNLPPAAAIPGGIPAGEVVPSLGGAVQGVAYGKHCYRGPKQPPFIRKTHRYVFTVYALDCRIALEASCGAEELRERMRGHILQEGTLTGLFGRAELRKDNRG